MGEVLYGSFSADQKIQFNVTSRFWHWSCIRYRGFVAAVVIRRNETKFQVVVDCAVSLHAEEGAVTK